MYLYAITKLLPGHSEKDLHSVLTYLKTSYENKPAPLDHGFQPEEAREELQKEKKEKKEMQKEKKDQKKEKKEKKETGDVTHLLFGVECFVYIRCQIRFIAFG